MIMIIKICGIKTIEVALTAVEAGADMLGFNFYPPSPRYITPGKCAEIISHITHNASRITPPASSITTVGIFVNETSQHIREIMETCKLDLAQLSGAESPGDLAALDGAAFKAVRPRSLREAQEQLGVYGRQIAPALLVDAHVKGAYGGTGETGDWDLARHLAAQAPILLAGGLNPENVALAVRAVDPWGVDVASGVESSPGVKDPAKISAFISAVRSGASQ
jgi:phosphoribosylanthranilate isomerase